jgi:hypothetical protein
MATPNCGYLAVRNKGMIHEATRNCHEGKPGEVSAGYADYAEQRRGRSRGTSEGRNRKQKAIRLLTAIFLNRCNT